MQDLSRRSFLAGSAGTAVGAAVVGGLALNAVTAAEPTRFGSTSDASARADLAKGVMVYVRDAGAGEVVLMTDRASRPVTDPALVAAIARALQSAGS